MFPPRIKKNNSFIKSHEINAFKPNVPFLYLLRTSENFSVLTFSEIAEIQHWVKMSYQHCRTVINYTAWKVSVFGVFPVRIPSHSDWIPCFQSKCVNIRSINTPNTDTFYAGLKTTERTIFLAAKITHLGKFNIYPSKVAVSY